MELIQRVSEYFGLEFQWPQDRSVSSAQTEKISTLADSSTKYDKEDLIFHQPKSFSQVQKIVKGLEDEQLVIVNLTQTEHDIASRIIDFMSGAIYALNGSSEKIAKDIFLFAPQGIEMSYETQEDNLVRETGLSAAEKESLDAKE